jgi:hypothetical protein
MNLGDEGMHLTAALQFAGPAFFPMIGLEACIHHAHRRFPLFVLLIRNRGETITDWLDFQVVRMMPLTVTMSLALLQHARQCSPLIFGVQLSQFAILESHLSLFCR